MADHSEARRLEAAGVPRKVIAYRLGVSRSTVSRWLDPRQAQLDRESRLRRYYRERGRVRALRPEVTDA